MAEKNTGASPTDAAVKGTPAEKAPEPTPQAPARAHPVSTPDTQPPPAASVTADTDDQPSAEESESDVLMSDEPPVDTAAVTARQKQAKKDAAAARKIGAAKAEVRRLKEELDPDALTLDDVADDSETEAQQDFSWDIRPDFQTMDEEGCQEYMKHLTRWLRDRDATVRGPRVDAHEVEDTAAVEVTREGSTTPGSAKKKTMTVYEGFYEWEYPKGDLPEKPAPITIRTPNVTRLDALRDTCRMAVVRRYEV